MGGLGVKLGFRTITQCSTLLLEYMSINAMPGYCRVCPTNAPILLI